MRREVRRCRGPRCGVGFTWPPPAGAPAAPGWDPRGLAGRAARAVARAELRPLRAARRPPADLVDVGAGAGLRAQAAADLGYRVTAVEPDPGEAARAGGRPGIARVVARTLDEARDRVGPADAVLAWHVLEHLPDLDAGVAALAAPLRDGGVLVIGVPNAGGLEARALRGRWHGWEAARHRWHLTGAALGAVLGASGLEVLRLGPSGGWRYPSSLAYSLAPGLDPQRDPGRGPLGAALAAALVPLALLERAAGAGPQLVAVARRR